jgi:hypothetical protein
MGAFDFIAQGVQPVQLADPMRLAAAGMSLADLARRNRQGEEDEQFKALERQSDQLATQGLMRARQGGDVQSVFADLSRQGEAGAMAARKMAKFMQEQQKADDDSAYKRAQTNDSTAGAAKKTQDMKLDGLKQFATLGTAIASGQAPVNENTQSAMFEVARQVLPPEIVRTMPADPAKFREWATVMASPEAVAKIAENQAQTSKVQLETQQMPDELKVKQQNARSSAVSAGASASNAATNRMQYENPNLQHIGTPETGISTFNPRTGAVGTAQGANPNPKLTEKQRNEVAGLQAEFAAIDRAISMAKANPGAFGVAQGVASEAGPLAQSLAGRVYSPNENAARSAVFNTVSSVIKDRAGTAQSAQEQANILRFMPGPHDGAPQIVAKFQDYQEYMRTRAGGYVQPVGAGRGILGNDKPAPAAGGWGKVEKVGG